MRMKYMYHLLKENFEDLENFQMVNDPYKVGSSSTNRGRVDNWVRMREALVCIKTIPSLQNVCVEFLDNPFFAKKENTFYIPYETYQELLPKHKNLLVQIKSIIDFYEAAGFDTTESGFDVKMPTTDDLEEFSKNISLLSKVIGQCPYLNTNDEKIALKKTDIGSIWFEFVVIATGTSLVLLNLSKVIDKCIKIKSHYVTVKQQEESLRQLKLKNDVLEPIKEANEKIIKAVIDDCITELQDEIPEMKLNNDDVTRVHYSLETISKLMEKGMEIYASIDAPQEIKDLFPTSDEIAFLPKPQKLLEGNSEE